MTPNDLYTRQQDLLSEEISRLQLEGSDQEVNKILKLRERLNMQQTRYKNGELVLYDTWLTDKIKENIQEVRQLPNNSDKRCQLCKQIRKTHGKQRIHRAEKRLVLKIFLCEGEERKRERGKLMNQLIFAIHSTCTLYMPEYQHELFYEDALNEILMFCCASLNRWGVSPTNTSVYNPYERSLTRWSTTRLRWRLKDLARLQRRIEQEQFRFYDEDGKPRDFPVESEVSDPMEQDPVEQLIDWAQQDVTEELRRTRLREHPHITAQVIILHRLPPDPATLDSLADKFGIPKGTMRNFWTKKCLPLLKRFAEGLFN